jgi:hypothetical protein
MKMRGVATAMTAAAGAEGVIAMYVPGRDMRGDHGVAMPSFAATERIAAYSFSYSPRCPATSRTATHELSSGPASAWRECGGRKACIREPRRPTG